jgi:hypothetical protein
VFISLKIVKELLPYYKLGHIVTVLDQMEYLRTKFLAKKEKQYWLGFAMARNEHLKQNFFFTQTLKENGKLHCVFYSSLVIPGMFENRHNNTIPNCQLFRLHMHICVCQDTDSAITKKLSILVHKFP